jgi:hypothetical protein
MCVLFGLCICCYNVTCYMLVDISHCFGTGLFDGMFRCLVQVVLCGVGGFVGYFHNRGFEKISYFMASSFVCCRHRTWMRLTV